MPITRKNCVYDPIELGSKIIGPRFWVTLHEGEDDPTPISWAKERKLIRFNHKSWGVIEGICCNADWYVPQTTTLVHPIARIWDEEYFGGWVLKIPLSTNYERLAADTKFRLTTLTVSLGDERKPT